MTRRILLTLGSTTDAERCGDCEYLGHFHCDIFGALEIRDRIEDAERDMTCIITESAAETATTAWITPCHRCGVLHLARPEASDGKWMVPVFCRSCSELNQAERSAANATQTRD